MQVAEKCLMEPRPAHLLVRTHMTDGADMPSLVFVPTTWPRDDFLDYLAALRDRESIKDPSTMMRMADLDPSMHTNWKKGAQPTTESLDALAPVLNTTAMALYIAAGRMSAKHLSEGTRPDLVVMPKEFDDLIDLYKSADTEGRTKIRDQISFVVRGLRDLFAESTPAPRPGRGRRTG